MTKPRLAGTVLSTAIGLALAVPPGTIFAQGSTNPPPVVKQNMERMAQQHLEKCYGINAVAKNDCAEGAHSCAARRPLRATASPSSSCQQAIAVKSRAAI